MDESELVEEGSTKTAKAVRLNELSPANQTGLKLLDGNFSVIAGLKVTVEVVVGSAEVTVEELFALQKGSILPLDQLHNAPLIVRLNGKPIASGSLVVVDENFGVCITEILATTL